MLVKEKAVNPWGELYEFLTGKDKLNFALEPEMRVLYTAIRDFSAHCAIFDSATPSSMAPKNELPLLLVASHLRIPAKLNSHSGQREHPDP
ncbi:hypothetical protein [Aeromonas sp. FL131]|uniref:hypothetical protein n=1 Tax=Aeromonas sp. FL131 TaxID=3416715 RepID=UPI003CF5F64D